MAEYKALYRKWRPFDFDDVCGQERITDILKYEVASDRVSHAYLFCGSRGTGKTSCAKILAKAVNCENARNGNPCNECDACRSIDAGIATDVIEMDAASNNGVDNVRNLKDEISFTPALLKYRVYIIDEVHMMSGAAFNALLKTLEEPPKYVVFILATTEFHKLPTTIVSRCQRFDFRRISSDTIVSRLFKISKSEGIDLSEDGARLIARASRGGMRDAVSLLELCAGSKQTVDADLVAATIGTGDRESAYRLIEAIGKSDFSTVYSIINDTVMSSGDISVFWQEIIDSYRDMMVVRNTDRAKSYLDLTDGEYERVREISKNFSMAKLIYHTTILEGALSDMQRATNAKRSIAEIALTRMCDPKLLPTAEALAVRIEELEKQIAMIKMGAVVSAPQPSAVTVDTIPEEPDDESDTKKNEPSDVKMGEFPRPYESFGSVLERIGEIKKSLSSQFVGATAQQTSDSSFVIKMSEFFAQRISNSPQDLSILKGVIAELEGKNPSDISVIVKSKSTAKSSAIDSDFKNI